MNQDIVAAFIELVWPELSTIPNEVERQRKARAVAALLEAVVSEAVEQGQASQLAVFQGIDRRFGELEKLVGIDAAANERKHVRSFAPAPNVEQVIGSDELERLRDCELVVRLMSTRGTYPRFTLLLHSSGPPTWVFETDGEYCGAPLGTDPLPKLTHEVRRAAQAAIETDDALRWRKTPGSNAPGATS